MASIIAIHDNLNDWEIVFSTNAMKDKQAIEAYLGKVHKITASKTSDRRTHIGKTNNTETVLDIVEALIAHKYNYLNANHVFHTKGHMLQLFQQTQ